MHLLRKEFPQYQCHIYSPFTLSSPANTGSDVLEHHARGLLQEVIRLINFRGIHRNNIKEDNGTEGSPSNDLRIVFLGHDLGGSVIKKVHFEYSSSDDDDANTARLWYLRRNTSTFGESLQSQVRLYAKVTGDSNWIAYSD